MGTARTTPSLLSRILASLLAVFASVAVASAQGTISSQTALGAKANPATYGQAVTFTATVTAGDGSTTPTGTVTFMENGQALPGGIGVAASGGNPGGVATYSYVTTSLAAGTHYYSAAFSGDSSLAASSGAMAPPLVVNLAPTATSLSGGGSSAYGQTVTFTATVTPRQGSGTISTGGVVFLDGSNVLAAVRLGSNSNGTAASANQAVLTIPGAGNAPLNIATHTITASYSGDSANFAGSPASNAVTQKVTQATTTISSLGSSSSASVYGQPVTFTATVASASNVPMPDGGVVTFKDGSTSYTGILASGSASFTSASLALGSHSITVTYGGDIYNQPSAASTPLALTVSQASSSTAVALASGPNPSYFGQPVTFSATVTAAAPSTLIPAGTVTFFLDGTAVGSPVNLSNGVATWTTSALMPGTTVGGSAGPQLHYIWAVYAGNADFAASPSIAFNQTVGPAPDSLVLNASPTAPSYGQAVTLTASGLPTGANPATGTVTFYDGANLLGTGTVSGGKANFATSAGAAALAVGNHSFTAQYGGDADHVTPPATQPVALVVAPATPAISAVTAVPASPVLNQPTAFTVTLSGAGLAPTGTVSFTSGAAALGSATLASPGPGQPSSATASAPMATLGSNTITATYSGDPNYGSVTKTLTLTVGVDTTGIALASSAPSQSYGTPVTLTATVTLNNPGSATLAPTGTVTFSDAYTNTSGTTTSSTLASGVTGSPSQNTATYTYTSSSTGLKAGTHLITATYNGDTDSGKVTSSPFTQTVTQNGTSLAVTDTVSDSTGVTTFSFDKPVSLVATLASTPVTSGLATGTVTFTDAYTGPGSSTPTVSTLGTASLATSGTATLALNNLLLGAHSITATYSGDNNFTAPASASSALGLTVDAPTSTSVVSSQNPSTNQGTVTFTAAVGIPSNFSGTVAGTIDFYDGKNLIGSGSVSGGSASYTTSLTGPSALAAGSHAITAQFLSSTTGLANSTSGALTQVVDQVTTTTLAASGGAGTPPFLYGQPVTLTATVADSPSGASTPNGGSVTFLDGTASLGSAALVNGTATLTTSTLAPTNTTAHSLTASYAGASASASGSVPFLASVSAALTPVVNQNTPTVTLSSGSTGAIDYSQTVTFTATVAAPAGTTGAAVPTGSVTFIATNTNPITGAVTTTTLGSANLSAGVASTTSAALAGGADSVTATYNGNANYTTASSNPLGQTVNSNLPTLALATNHPPSAPPVTGQAVTFTATLAPVAPVTRIPTGTVTFTVDSATTGKQATVSGGVASASIALTAGSHTVTALYSGDPDFSSISSSLTQVVNPGATATVLAPSANASGYGQPVTFSATVTAVAPAAGTPTGTVTFYAGGNPLGTAILSSAGKATFPTSAVPLGSNNAITASYGSDTNFAGSVSAQVYQTVVMGSSSVTLAPSAPSPVYYSQPLTLTATVTAAGSGTGTPTGTVTFNDGDTVLAAGVPLAGGLASFSPVLAPGSHSLTAAYSGDTNFNSFTSTVSTMTVKAATTSTGLTASGPSPSGLGENVSFTATVTTTSAGAAAPTGSVKFLDGSTLVDTETLVPNAPIPNTPPSASATFATNSLKLGNHSITATFVATAGAGTSTSQPAIIQTVANLIVTQTTLAAQTASPTYGQPVTLTATVTPAPTALTGAEVVIFYDNTVILGAGTLTLGGTATYVAGGPGNPNPPLAIGSHRLTATYGGDGTLAGSNGASSKLDTVNLTVAPGPTGITLASSPAVSNGVPTTLITATVTPANPADPAPYGTVTFTDTTTGTALGSGNLAPVAGSTTGASTASVTPSGPVGVGQTIGAAYAGDLHWAGSSASFSLTAGAPGAFSPLSPDALFTARTGHTATTLPPSATFPNGAILVAGGVDPSNPPNALASVEIHDPIDFDPSGPTNVRIMTLNIARTGHTATLLTDGTVLIAGGQDGNGNAVGTSEILDPANAVAYLQKAQTAAPRPDPSSLQYLAQPRFGHTATLLWDGTVLLAGGTCAGSNLSSMEILNPLQVQTAQGAGTGPIPSQTPQMQTARCGHTATLLPDGTVLLAGGLDNSAPPLAQASAEIFDPGNPAFTIAVGSMANARTGAAAVLVPAPAGPEVVILGGSNGSAALNSAEVYSVAAAAFTSVPAPMNAPRDLPTADLLYDGKLLIAGGGDAQGNPTSASSNGEYFDPAALTFTYVGAPLDQPRIGQTANLLQNGQLFIAGGVPYSLANPTTSPLTLELFDPQDLPGTAQPLPAAAFTGFPPAAPAITGTLAATATSPNQTYFWQLNNVGSVPAQYSALGAAALAYTLPTVLQQNTTAAVNLLVTNVYGIPALPPSQDVPPAVTLTDPVNPFKFRVTDPSNAVWSAGSILPGGTLYTATVCAPQTLPNGANLTYTWTLTSTGSAPNIVGFSTAPPFSFSFTPANYNSAPVTFTLTCQAVDPSGNSSTTVWSGIVLRTVVGISSFTGADNGFTLAGAPFNLSWVTANATQLTLSASDGSINDLPVTGTSYPVPLGITSTTTYTLTAYPGPVSQTVTIVPVTTLGQPGITKFTAAYDYYSAYPGSFTVSATIYDGNGLPGNGSLSVPGGTPQAITLWSNTPQDFGPFPGTALLDLTGTTSSTPAQTIAAFPQLPQIPLNAYADSNNPASVPPLPSFYATATVLTQGPNQGSVLFAGGNSKNLGPLASIPAATLSQVLSPADLSSLVYIYDPLQQRFVTTTAGYPVVGHTATPFPDGTVLLAGGITNVGNDLTAFPGAYLFDPATATVNAVTSAIMTYGRYGHTATWIPPTVPPNPSHPRGLVLFVGGTDLNGAFQPAEVYDPGGLGLAATFAVSGGTMSFLRSGHTATLLQDGTVLIAGGNGVPSPHTHPQGTAQTTAEIYDPVTDTFYPVIPLNSPRAGHAAVPLPDGQVLLAGTLTGAAFDQTEVFQSAGRGTGSFTQTGYLPQATANPVGVLLPTLNALVAGGLANGSDQTDTELYAATTGLYDTMGWAYADTALPLGLDNATGAAAVVPDGRVLFADGALAFFDPLLGTSPVLSGPGSVLANTQDATCVATATPDFGGSYPASGFSFTWTITGGTFTGSTTGASVSFLPGDGIALNAVTLTCQATRNLLFGQNSAATRTAFLLIPVTQTPMTYAVPAPVYALNTAITPDTINAFNPPKGAVVASYGLAGTLPAGLSFDPASGTISGTPTAPATATTCSVTAYDASFDALATGNVTITVQSK